MLMDMCEVIAKRSTCNRGNIGALVWDPVQNDTVSIGYNGSLPGQPHCMDVGCDMGVQGGCNRTTHAEMNAMGRAVDKGHGNLRPFHLYCTSSPCINCAEMMTSLYIGRLYYRHPYRNKSGLESLLTNYKGLSIFRVMPAGIIINERTGQVEP